VSRVTKTANRWLLLVMAALACLGVPAAAGGATSLPSTQCCSLTPVVEGTPGSNGWYRSNVLVSWTFVPNPPLTVQGCFVGAITAQGHTHIDCKASWGPLGSAERILDVYIDKTAPTVHAVPSRPPDANGWYNKPVSFTFAGTDATSGIASCSSLTYSGPDNAKAAVAGTCTDKAGNVGHAVYRFAYDSTPPTISSLSAEHGNRSVLLSWKTSVGTQVTQVTRGGTSPHKVVYRGTGVGVRDTGLRVGARYTYTVTAVDEAGNTSNATLAVTATGPLTSPVPGQTVSSRPQLTWLPVKGATYYNVQLYRGGRILSRWPKRTSLTLPTSWTYQGHHHRLSGGSYRWYVWPGFGKKSQAHYGRLLGSSSFHR
jgi:hypothetical protein